MARAAILGDARSQSLQPALLTDAHPMRTETRHRHTRLFAFAAALAVFSMAGCLEENRDEGTHSGNKGAVPRGRSPPGVCDI